MASNGNFQGREVVIVEAVRTPVGRGHAGEGLLQGHPPLQPPGEDLLRADRAHRDRPVRGRGRRRRLRAAVRRAGRSTSAATPGSRPGLPIETPATTIDRQCGSAQQAINFAAALVASGVHDVVIGGGVEHMGHISFADGLGRPAGARDGLHPGADGALQPGPAGHLGRDDRRPVGDPPLRARRDRRALPPAAPPRATEEGRFEREIIPFQVNGDTYTTDQGIRPDTNIETLSQLKPAFKEDGKITAGNSSQVSDGAAAVLLMTADKAEGAGPDARARRSSIRPRSASTR